MNAVVMEANNVRKNFMHATIAKKCTPNKFLQWLQDQSMNNFYFINTTAHTHTHTIYTKHLTPKKNFQSKYF